jgi:hypothetical protein
MNEARKNDLGPLPRADRNAELQQLSIAALRSSLPPDKFRFRDERVDDTGVDGSLELLVDGRYTNLRSQVQVKSTDSIDANADGSLSVKVKVSNLNYLLNGPSPLYVLYIDLKKELRFAWARDERKRLDESNPEWSAQEHVTLRFAMPLNAETLGEIHQRIAQDARFQRRVNDILDAASATDQVIISIDPAKLGITDSEEAKTIVINSGTAYVSAGYALQVKNLIRILHPKDAQAPRILLVNAYADYSLGRLQSCIALLAETSLSHETFSQDDQLFLKMLRDSCEYQLGRITMDEFLRRLEQQNRDNATGVALSNRLAQIRYAFYSEDSPERRTALVSELRSLVEAIVSSLHKSDVLKVRARIQLLEVEGNQFVFEFLRKIGDSRLKLAFGRAPDFHALFQAQIGELKDWEAKAACVIKDAIASGSPSLVAAAIITRGQFVCSVLANQLILFSLHGRPIVLPQAIAQEHIDEAFQAIETFKKAGNLEAELRSKMLLADLYELVGRQSDAQQIAKEVLPIAKIMEFANLISRAEQHIAGKALHSQLAEIARPKSEREKTVILAAASNEELRQKATQMLRVLELPPERLPIMERDYNCCRDTAREKLHWCMHIDVLQDKTHELHRETLYRTDPDRACICSLHKHRSILESSDWVALISAFKRSYCESCTDRTPLT